MNFDNEYGFWTELYKKDKNCFNLRLEEKRKELISLQNSVLRIQNLISAMETIKKDH